MIRIPHLRARVVVHTCVAGFAEVNGYLATDAAGGADDKCDFGGWLGHDGNLMSSKAIELEVEVGGDGNGDTCIM